MRLHHLLQTIGARSQPSLDASSASSAQSSPAEGSWPKQQRQQRRKAEGSSSEAGSSLAAAAAAVVQAMQQQASHGLSIDGFASVEDSTAFEYAAAAVQVGLWWGMHTVLWCRWAQLYSCIVCFDKSVLLLIWHKHALRVIMVHVHAYIEKCGVCLTGCSGCLVLRCACSGVRALTQLRREASSRGCGPPLHER